jgi:hypothetical protein
VVSGTPHQFTNRKSAHGRLGAGPALDAEIRVNGMWFYSLAGDGAPAQAERGRMGDCGIVMEP